MKTSRKQVSPSLSFAAGALVGAIVVFVPLTSSGHPGSNFGGSAQSSPGGVRSSVSVAGRNAGDADSAPSTKQDSSTSNVVSNETTCDVQLD